MNAVHFGAGNIGRGFIGCLLNQAGYQLTFLDVNAELVSLLNEIQAYEVVTLEDQPQTIKIHEVKAINSRTEEQKAIDAISNADLVTTAVGPQVLPLIAPTIARGLNQRLMKNPSPLQVIACENMLNSSQELMKHVLSHCSPTEQQRVETWIDFPNAVVDRIVPNQSDQKPLLVKVEPYYEWVVDQKGIKSKKPAIPGVHFVASFDAYVARKLFTVNTGHAITAYLGYQVDCSTITEAINHPDIERLVKGCFAEIGELLVQKYNFTMKEHQQYVERILYRFQNPYIIDQVTRVARSPLRKLGSQDRLLLPALHLLEMGIQPVYIATGIAAALAFDWDEDIEAVKIQAIIKQKGIAQAFAEIAELDIHHPLIELVVERYMEIKK